MLLKILTVLRMAMTQDVPEVFEGIAEVDGIYFAGQGGIKGCQLSERMRSQSEEEEQRNKYSLVFSSETEKYGQN